MSFLSHRNFDRRGIDFRETIFCKKLAGRAFNLNQTSVVGRLDRCNTFPFGNRVAEGLMRGVPIEFAVVQTPVLGL